jgi:hypothetical protein
MARVATYLLAAIATPCLDTGVYNVRRDVAMPNAGASNGDTVPILTIPRAGRLTACDLSVSATLGAGCTVKLALYRAGASVRDLTIATTAAAAGFVNSGTLGPIDVLAGDEITMVIGGANVGAAATLTTDIRLQH